MKRSKVTITGELYAVRIFMKSGNVVDLDGVREMTWKKTGSGRTITLTQAPGGRILLNSSLDLNQVEAITFQLVGHEQLGDAA